MNAIPALGAAATPSRRDARLLAVAADGKLSSLLRAAFAELFEPGDLVVANDAATLPASLTGTHGPTGRPIELRLAGWVTPGDPHRFAALAFGDGDHRMRTEDRPQPPPLRRGDRLELGPLTAVVEATLGHPRLLLVRFPGNRASVFGGLARHGRPIQYAHVPAPLALWDVWTSLAALPVAFEPPSAGFALDWRVVYAWRRRGIGFATLTHAAGISSTGDPELDARLPFDEPYRIPPRTAAMVAETKRCGGRVIAIGTTVVRALEAAASADRQVREGEGIARGRIGAATPLAVVDAILTGVHQPGESHFELLAAFADRRLLERISGAFLAGGYRAHEFGDSMLLERQRVIARDTAHPGPLHGQGGNARRPPSPAAPSAPRRHR
jgi:S-adenosylmethionine:tRNA ribosyltransferase-isomerase